MKLFFKEIPELFRYSRVSGWVTDLAADFDENNGSIGKFTKCKEVRLKLDPMSGMFAVFMLGFSADTIKNQITRPNNGE